MAGRERCLATVATRIRNCSAIYIVMCCAALCCIVLQVELIADELKGWADRDILQQLQTVLSQVLETQEQQKLVSGMLGL